MSVLDGLVVVRAASSLWCAHVPVSMVPSGLKADCFVLMFLVTIQLSVLVSCGHCEKNPRRKSRVHSAAGALCRCRG